MILKELKIANFRNYKSLNIKLSDKINIIYGNNAQGKTNILESIYVLGITKSHRSFIDDDLIMTGEKESKIVGITYKNGMDSLFEIDLNNKKKKYKIDNDEIKKTSDYISNMNIIIFYPEDLEIIKGSPGIRRKFLNLELSQLYNNYYRVLSDYNKLLKIRNDYLKKMQKNIQVDQNYFSILTEYLIDKAVFIYRARNKFIKKINSNASNIFWEIMHLEDFSLKYKTNFDFKDYTEEEIKEQLKAKFDSGINSEIKLGNTLYGPHRDDFEFYLGDKNLKAYGSQGQQRIAVISIKLAEIEIFKNYSKTTPILLLDDVFSELDDEKKNNLLKYIKDDIQTIITTTDLENIDETIIKSAKLFKIESGRVVDELEEVKENEWTTLWCIGYSSLGRIRSC